jgi:magnesium transporter
MMVVPPATYIYTIKKGDILMKTVYNTIGDRLVKCAIPEKGCWIHLQNPTKEEIESLNIKFSLDPTYLMAALDEEESARIEHDEGQTLITVDTPHIDAAGNGYVYSTIPIGIILADEVTITVATREPSILTDFIEERVRGFCTYKQTRFVLQILQRNSSRFLTYLKQIDKVYSNVQMQLEKSLKNRELLQMMKLQKSLVFFSTSLKGNEAVMEKLLRLDMLKKFPENTDLLEDVIIENKQAREMCAIYRDIMSGTMDAFASIISNNLNIVMKVLTSLTVVMAIPTIFSSLWGMNVAVPFGNSTYGFWIVLGMSVVTAIIAFIFLWRKKMF